MTAIETVWHFHTARVSVTSFHPGQFGGGVLIGWQNSEEVRAKIRESVLPREPEVGEVWRVTGRIDSILVHDHRTGTMIPKRHIIAEFALPVAPSGAGIQRWIARHPNISGVGAAYAERLWDALGPKLYDHLRNRDVGPLAAVLDVRKAHAIIEAWRLLADEVTALEALDEIGVSGATAMAALRLFGAAAAERFRGNPYQLSLLEPWSRVDAVALTSGILPDDPRRLSAAVDVAAAKVYRTTESHMGGHTVVTRGMLSARVRSLLGGATQHLAEAAVEQAIETGALLHIGNERFQARAPWLMEREIEDSIATRLAAPRPEVPAGMVGLAIAEVEREDGISLDPLQREAVHMAVTAGFACLAGGAGTGKSTVCKAIMRAIHLLYPPEKRELGEEQTEVTCCQIAVSGRAAKRLREATGGRAITVYRYLKASENKKIQFTRGLLVIDEISMVGTPDLWRVLTVTPEAISILLIGDVAQLPPISAGYPARAIMSAERVPRVTLASIHRQKTESGIPVVAAAIRDGRIPHLMSFDFETPNRAGVFMLPCKPLDASRMVLEAFAALTGPPPVAGDHAGLERLHERDVQILCMNKGGPAGTKKLSAAIEDQWLGVQPSIHNWGLRVGSKILWTKNSYDRPSVRCRQDGGENATEIMNGALGMVRGIALDGSSGAMVRFDHADYDLEIWEDDLQCLTFGWAITVHKAQGSAFERIIIPITPGRMLDRAMLYTAVTRARQTAVLVGDTALLNTAIQECPRSWQRMQALDPDHAIDRVSEGEQ